MKRKLFPVLVFLTLAVGYCTPQDPCGGFNQPSLCHGTKGPQTVVIINNQPRIIGGK